MTKRKSAPQAAALPAKLKAADLTPSSIPPRVTPPPLPVSADRAAKPDKAKTEGKKLVEQAGGGLAKDDQRRTYCAVSGQHPGLAGPVSMNNWVGHINGTHRTVDRLAPMSTIPQIIVDAMLKDGMRFDTVPGPSTAAPARASRKGPTAVKSLGKVGPTIR